MISQYLIDEHSKITKHLGQDVLDYLKNLDINLFRDVKEKHFFIDYITVALKEPGKSHKKIASLVKGVTRYTISRKTERLNQLLTMFCENRIEPPIQLFYHHRNPGKKNEKPGSHFACCKSEIFQDVKGNSALHSYLITPFEEAFDLQGRLRQQFKSVLKSQAQKHLKEKLHDKENDYRRMDLEIGVFGEPTQDRKLQPAPAAHNRQWSDFDYSELKKPQGVFVLSSETGSGKTTFLRHLQLSIIKDTNLIPIFLEASSMATLDYRNNNKNNFLEGIAKLFNGYLQNNHECDFLQTHLDKLVFLIDGLDQMGGTGTEYNSLIDKLTGVIEGKLIIASRPFAVIDKEKDLKFKFLRLKPFSEREANAYFGKKYKRAKEICRSCPEMLYIPMLAYMVRLLINTGEDKGIRNRADLYGKFITHIFENHLPNNLKISLDDKEEIRDVLGEISFRAISSKESYLQKIPYRVAKDCLHKRGIRSNNITIEMLLKAGLPDTLVNQSGEDGRSIYFSHLSFQEYLAAEWASQDVVRMNTLINVIIEKHDRDKHSLSDPRYGIVTAIGGGPYIHCETNDDIVSNIKIELWAKMRWTMNYPKYDNIWSEIMNFLMLLTGSMAIKISYQKWQEDKSSISKLEVASLFCENGIKSRSIYSELLFSDIIGLLNHYKYSERCNNKTVNILYYFKALLRLYPRKANDFIFMLIKEQLYSRSEINELCMIACKYIRNLHITKSQVSEIIDGINNWYSKMPCPVSIDDVSCMVYRNHKIYFNDSNIKPNQL